VADHTWPAVSALVDPVRRALYDYVRRGRHPVTREEAANAVDISRNLAAFHLDKLVEVGLLGTHYEAPGEQPRGRGRTPKVYEAAGRGVELTVPERHYELVGTILADAIATDASDARAAANARAAELGRGIGAATGPFERTGEAEAATTALTDLGYEPRRSGDEIVLDNCPFHALATRQTELICGINLAFVDGLLGGLGCDALAAELRPRPDGCCVRVRGR
jgi:predicted ArsR family transcriptional regulator